MAKRKPSSGAQPERRNLGRLLYVPVPLRKHILEERHSTSYSGHLGVDKTTAAIQRRFWWPHPYGDDWDQRIGDLDFAYNNSEQRSTGQTPFFLLHGFHPRVPVDLYNSEAAEEIPAAREFVEQMIAGHEAAAAAMERSSLRQKEQYDKRRTPSPFQPGDWVLLSAAHYRFQGRTDKLTQRFLGRYLIEWITEDKLAAKLRLPRQVRIHR